MIGIAERRLRAQRLVGEPFASAIDAVRWLGAVQSQDFGGAKWALGQRVDGATEAGIDRLFDEGALLRTHVMRPTWHFVLPEDIHWLLKLTGPRIRLGLAARYRQLGLDDDVAGRANAAFGAALAGGHHLTRRELADTLLSAGIPPDGQRLAHLLMGAELDGLIVSGPRRGTQPTYALLEERAPQARQLDRTEALAVLACRYFRSHGPAQIQDFVWWSGLTVADARGGIALAGTILEQEVVDGKRYWFDAQAGWPPEVSGIAHLLPNFDEYTVGYRERGAIVHPLRPLDPALFSFGSVLSNIVTLNGRVAGAWRRTAIRDSVRVEVRVLDRLQPEETAAVENAARRLGRFLECVAELSWR